MLILASLRWPITLRGIQYLDGWVNKMADRKGWKKMGLTRN